MLNDHKVGKKLATYILNSLCSRTPSALFRGLCERAQCQWIRPCSAGAYSLAGILHAKLNALNNLFVTPTLLFRSPSQ